MTTINKDIFICKLLLVLIYIYFIQSAIFSEGFLIGQPILLSIYIICFGYIFKYFKKNNDFFPKLILIFLLIQTLWFFLTIMFTNYDPGVSQYKSVLLNFLPFFAFKYFSEKKILKRKYLVYFLYGVLPFFIIKIIENSAKLRLTKFNQDTIVDNTIYYFVGLLPFVLLIKNRVIAFIIFSIIWFYIIESAKRGGLISGIIAMIIFFILLFMEKKKNLLQSIKKNIIYSFIIAVVSYFAITTLQEKEFLILRIQKMLDGDTSGRDDIAIDTINYWLQDDNIFIFFFGSGYNSIHKITNHVSHNDWLDMISSFGIFGLCIYALIYICIIKYALLEKITTENRLLIFLYLAIALLTSFTSRWYWASFAYMQIFILPYILTKNNFKINEDSSIR